MKGFIGIDEVGRGPLAGPVTVCAFYLEDDKKALKDFFSGEIKDSKKLKKEKREEIFKKIKSSNGVIFSVTSRPALHIDKNGINNSIKACINSCLKSLEKKGVDVKNVSIELDGGLRLGDGFKKQKTYIKGDEKFVSIALASICAKVTRDNYMEKLSKVHTEYDWCKNVGYGTLSHRMAIKKYGITKYHRKTFLKK